MSAEGTTRAEHMAWCKQRALAELDDGGDVGAALASMASDVRKGPATDGNQAVTLLLAMEGTRLAMDGDVAGMRRFIEGFA